jgi:hypothetical protein
MESPGLSGPFHFWRPLLHLLPLRARIPTLFGTVSLRLGPKGPARFKSEDAPLAHVFPCSLLKNSEKDERCAILESKAPPRRIFRASWA